MGAIEMTMTLVSNRYRVVRELGKGGFGTTSLVEDTQLPSGRRCVLKELMPVESSAEIHTLVKQRFEREAVILEELGNLTLQIPSLYAYFAEDNKFYLVQEYVEGETVAQKVQSQGVMSDAAVREWLLGLLPVLGVVHDRKIIHRDIKPENVILRQRDHKPVLIDFGAVRETMGTLINANGQSTQSIVIGTPGFMPSEQAAGRAVFSSDLYSLGMTAIYALTGKIPQELPTDPMTGNVQWRQFAPTVSAGLAAVIDRAVMPVSRDRFQTVSEMQTQLSGSNESNQIPGTVVSTTPGVISNPVMTVPPVEQFPQTNNSNYQPTIVAAHASYPSQPLQPPQPQSIASLPKQGLSDWAKAMIMGGFIGTFILIALVLTRSPQTTQASNTAPAVTTPVSPSPSATPSTAPAPVAAAPQSAPQQAPAPQTVIVQAAPSDKETVREVVKEREPEKPVKNTGNTNATIVGQSGSKNIRSGPGTKYSEKHLAYPGDRVRVLETSTDSGGYTWHKVYFPESGADGWIAGQLLNIDR